MNILKRIADFFIHHNLVISSSGAFLTYGITSHYGLANELYYAIIVFLLCYSTYTLQRIVDHSEYTIVALKETFERNQVSVILSVMSLLLALSIGLTIFHSSRLLFLITCFFSFTSIWYTLPIFGKKLREIPRIKTVVIAITWGFSTAFFPLYNEGVALHEASFIALLISIYFFAITLPFDIRDKQVDDLSQQTLPQMIGQNATKLIGVGLLLFYFFEATHYEKGIAIDWLLLIAISAQLLLILLTTEQKKMTYFGLIDACILLLGISFIF